MEVINIKNYSLLMQCILSKQHVVVDGDTHLEPYAQLLGGQPAEVCLYPLLTDLGDVVGVVILPRGVTMPNMQKSMNDTISGVLRKYQGFLTSQSQDIYAVMSKIMFS